MNENELQLVVMTTEPQLLVWDTETTGLTLHPNAAPHKQPKMIEFGAVLLSLRDGRITFETNKLIHPAEDVTPEITKITGITNDALKDAPPFRSHLPFLRALFASSSSMVAHNLPFDRDILRWELVRHEADPLTRDFPWPAREFCTMNMFTPMWGRPPKLVEIYEAVLGKPYAQTHRALDDVKAMVEVIQKERLWEVMQ
jgi:DNA polymerase III epsilon subunit-like protein